MFLNGIEAGTTQPDVVLPLELEEGEYTVGFGAVTGWIKPGDERVVIEAGGEVHLAVTYQPSSGDKPWLIPAAMGLGLVALAAISKSKGR